MFVIRYKFFFSNVVIQLFLIIRLRNGMTENRSVDISFYLELILKKKVHRYTISSKPTTQNYKMKEKKLILMLYRY